MGWLRRRLGLERKSGIDVLLDYLESGGASRSGVSVTAKTALEHTAVLAGTRSLANGIAGVPCRLITESDDGRTRLPVKGDPRYMLLARKPNAWQTSFEFREFMMFNAVLSGAGYAYKVAGVDGAVKELLPFAAQRVEVVQKPNFDLAYKLSFPDGGQLEVPAERMLVLRGPSGDGAVALNTVRLMREALGLAIAAERHQALMHGNGGRPGGILTTDQNLPPDSIENVKKSWKESFSADNVYKTAILHSGFKWMPLAQTGVEAQSLETRRFQLEEVARGLGIFPAVIGHSDKSATYASVEQFFLAHEVHSLTPWAQRFQEVLERDLLTDEEWRRGYRWRFYLQARLRGDMKGRAAFMQTTIALGVMTRNEWRGLEDLNPLPGLDEPIVVSNLAGGDGEAQSDRGKPEGEDDDDEE